MSFRQTDEPGDGVEDDHLASLDTDDLVCLYVRGRSGALGEIWRRHHAQMRTMARSDLRLYRPSSRTYDVDDALSDAVSRLTERTLAGGLIDRLSCSDESWSFFRDLLRQCIRDEHERNTAIKRGGYGSKKAACEGGRRILSGGRRPGPVVIEDLDLIASPDLGPEVTVLSADVIRRLFELLDGEQCLIASLRRDDLTVQEIAERTNLSERTIARRLKEIRRLWGRSGLLD